MNCPIRWHRRSGTVDVMDATAPRVKDLADATPATRDRYIDFLRIFAIATVVVGHWLMAVVQNGSGGVRTTNALAVLSGAQWLTWLFQVMPVFFFVGGFAHWTGLRSVSRRGGGYADFVRARAARLLRPTAVFLALWTLAAVVAGVLGVRDGIGALALRTIAQPLWFVGVYLGIIAVAPVMFRLHQRFGLVVPVVLGVAAIGVDLVRFGAGISAIGALNVAFVWLACHQLGFCYADGMLTWRSGAAMAGVGFAALVVLTLGTGLYPVSMVGLPGEPVSNMNPPTVALAMQAMWLIGLVLLVRVPVSRWLERRRVWTAVVAGNGVVMTTFLWHLTALYTVYAVALSLRIPLPDAGSALWWLTRPLWLVVLAGVCAALVAVFRSFEQPRPVNRVGGSTMLAALGMALACLGVLGVALVGFDGLLAGRSAMLVIVPISAGWALALVASGWALTSAGRTRSSLDRPSVRPARLPRR